MSEKQVHIVSKVIYRCMGYRKGENVLIVTDDKLKEMAEFFYAGIKDMGIEVVLMRMVPRKIHGEEPPREIASALKSSQIALLITEKSLSHTRARQAASRQYGARIASMPGITLEILKRSIDINYESLRGKIRGWTQRLNSKKILRVTGRNGTDLVMSIKGRKIFEDNGLYITSGAFGNLPAGEICLAPVEGTTNGSLIVDASFSGIGKLHKPVKIEIKNGRAVRINNQKLINLLEPLGETAFNIAEFGIGLNPKARVTGNILEDEKALDTAHIALGDNLSFGGAIKAGCHLDGVFLGPRIHVE